LVLDPTANKICFRYWRSCLNSGKNNSLGKNLIVIEEYWYYVDYTIDDQYIGVYGYVFGAYLADYE
jgi:hypothetical protein